MMALLFKLLDIVLLRAGPQDLPPGRAVAISCVALYVGVTGISLSTGRAPEAPLLVLVLAVVLPLLLCRLLLGWRGRLERYDQTIAALFGSSALLSAASLPLNLISGAEPSVPLAFGILLLFFWSFAVDGHIWRHALEISYTAGLALAVVLFAVTLVIITTLAGPL